MRLPRINQSEVSIKAIGQSEAAKHCKLTKREAEREEDLSPSLQPDGGIKKKGKLTEQYKS